MKYREFSYDAWCREQSGKIEAALREAARNGNCDNLAAWVVPPHRMGNEQPGYIYVGTDAPFFGADIVRLGPHGSRLGSVPYSHIYSLLWNAGKSYPVLPIDVCPIQSYA